MKLHIQMDEGAVVEQANVFIYLGSIRTENRRRDAQQKNILPRTLIYNSETPALSKIERKRMENTQKNLRCKT